MIALVLAASFLGAGAVAVDETEAVARVYAIDRDARIVTLVDPSGASQGVFAPPELPGYDLLQPGAIVDARWTQNLALEIEKPGAPPPPAGITARLAPKSGSPQDLVVPVRTELGVIQSLDRERRLLTFAPHDGAPFTVRVLPDVPAFDMARAQDTIVLHYAPATLLSAAPHAGR